MSRTKVPVLVCAFGAMILSVFAGCAAGTSGTGNAAEESPAPGEEAGPCFSDGTCGQELECVDDVCVQVDSEGDVDLTGEEGALLIFHNNSGPMCLAALDWLGSVQSQYPTLVIEEHLTYQTGETELLAELEAQFQTSQGVSMSFEYLPIVFFQETAFSGFNDEVAQMLQELLPAVASASS